MARDVMAVRLHLPQIRVVMACWAGSRVRGGRGYAALRVLGRSEGFEQCPVGFAGI